MIFFYNLHLKYFSLLKSLCDLKKAIAGHINVAMGPHVALGLPV